jgi:hypothetical protein
MTSASWRFLLPNPASFADASIVMRTLLKLLYSLTFVASALTRTLLTRQHPTFDGFQVQDSTLMCVSPSSPSSPADPFIVALIHTTRMHTVASTSTPYAGAPHSTHERARAELTRFPIGWIWICVWCVCVCIWFLLSFLLPFSFLRLTVCDSTLPRMALRSRDAPPRMEVGACFSTSHACVLLHLESDTQRRSPSFPSFLCILISLEFSVDATNTDYPPRRPVAPNSIPHLARNPTVPFGVAFHLQSINLCPALSGSVTDRVVFVVH